MADDGLFQVKMTEAGLQLPIDLGEKDFAQEGEVRQVTAADLAALAQVEAELDQRWGETQIDPTLSRMEQLMDVLGHPEQAFAAIHVAGTNGKTSTVRMIEALVRGFARRTGRTTSPHLQLATERIAIDGVPLHPQDYVRIWREIEPYVAMVDAQNEVRLSKFEILTAMAYAAFADAPVDVGVVEVGMGGRWDATNVINAQVAVICPVGLDHTDYLGDTLAKIAGEKAGIIHRAQWDPEDLLTPQDNVAIIGQQEPEALHVILEQAVAADAAVARFGQEFGVIRAETAVGGQLLTLQGLGGVYEDIFLPLAGAHQAHNAAVALAAVEAFFGAGKNRQLDVETVRAAFASVQSPGRMERMRSAPAVFIDATHNPHGAKALAQTLAEQFNFQRLVGVLGILGDKDARGIMEHLEPQLNEVVITQTTSPRVLPVDELAQIAREIFGEDRVHVAPQLADAIELGIALAEADADFDALAAPDAAAGVGVLITGSVVTAGQARQLFGKEPA